jgi:tetratricopeptide (TPR) repeat protein
MKAKNYFFLPFCLALLTGLFSCKNKEPQNTAVQPATATGNPAIDDLSQKIAASPNIASLYAQRGALFYQNEGYDEALADLEKAISLDSSQADYFHTLADVNMDYARSRQALAVMEKAVSLFPKRIPTLLKLAEFQLILKQNNPALFTLERIRGIDPLNAEMFFMFGNVFREMGKTDQAITAYQSAVENDPELLDAWIYLGELISEKNTTLAAKYFDNALRLDSSSVSALHAKAYFLSNKKNDLSGAVALYKKINTLDPQYTDGYYNLGLLYLDMDSLDQAYRSFDLAVKVAPTYAEAYYHRGIVAEKKGDIAQAKADFDNVLRLDSNFASAQEAVRRLAKKSG